MSVIQRSEGLEVRRAYFVIPARVAHLSWRLLDQPSNLTAAEREPCPDCGSLARVFEKSGSVIVGVSASAALTKIHEEIQRHWRWYVVALGLAAVGAVVGYFIGGLLGVVVGLVLWLIGIPVGERSVTRIREIEHRRGSD